MTVIVIVACLVIAGAELLLARGARRVADRLERLEALTRRQDERMNTMNARLRGPGPVTGGWPGAGVQHADPGPPEIAHETARLRERLSALEDARRMDHDLYAHLSGAVESLEHVVANVFRLTVGELDQAAAGAARGSPTGPGTARRAAIADTVELGRPRRRGRRLAVAGAMALAAAACVPLGAAVFGYVFGGAGAAVLSRLSGFLTTYGGVLALTTSTLSVVAGLVASDRVLLPIRQRIAAQAVHRAATLIAVGFLLTHVATMIFGGHARAVQAILPVGPAPLAIGTLAAQLLVFVSLTGLMRGRFAAGRRPGLWRAAHRLAYAGWVMAILHGLLAGRRPPGWVTWTYALCLAGAGLVLLARGLGLTRSRGAGGPRERARPPGGRALALRARTER